MGWRLEVTHEAGPGLTRDIAQFLLQQDEQNRVLRKSVEDLVGVVSRLVDAQSEMAKLYTPQGENKTDSLDERLLRQEHDSEWEPINFDPFGDLR